MFDDKSVDYDMYFEGTERRRSANLTAANPLRSPRQLSQSAISFQGEDGLTAFNRQWEVRLHDKKLEEERRTKAEKERAYQEKMEFYREREKIKDNRMASNRNHEQMVMEQIESDIDADDPWDMAWKLLDPQQEGQGSDLSRMREVLISLRLKDGDCAVGVSSSRTAIIRSHTSVMG